MKRSVLNIALAGDHSLNLHALAILLGQQGGFDVVSISKDASQLGNEIAHGGLDRYPHIVLLDINFDLHRATGIISFLKGAYSPIRIAALGLTKDHEAILRLLHMGVDCYIPKNFDADQLGPILRKVVDNGNYTTPLMEQAFGKPFGSPAHETNPAADNAWPAITASERRYFRLAMSEASNDDIRRRMNLCKSAFTHLVAKVFRLFGVRSRDGLVVALYRNRLMIKDDL